MEWTANNNNWQEAKNFSINSGSFGSCVHSWIGDPITYPQHEWTYPDIYKYYYYWWWPTVEIRFEKSKIDIAFKVIKILIDKKIINAEKLTVGKFIELVHELAKEL
jgi:hypothetical protein